MTFNILATAVVTPMTGWLVARFGAKRVMTLGILSFSVATCMCGLAQSLDSLVVWRIVQGATGAPVVLLSQTILMNTFPRRQHPMVLSMLVWPLAWPPSLVQCSGATLRRPTRGAGLFTCWCRWDWWHSWVCALLCPLTSKA